MKSWGFISLGLIIGLTFGVAHLTDIKHKLQKQNTELKAEIDTIKSPIETLIRARGQKQDGEWRIFKNDTCYVFKIVNSFPGITVMSYDVVRFPLETRLK